MNLKDAVVVNLKRAGEGTVSDDSAVSIDQLPPVEEGGDHCADLLI